MVEEPTSPQHDKARPHADDMQAIGEFIEWLTSNSLDGHKAMTLCRYEIYPGESRGYFPAHYNIQELLAEFYDIDYKAYLAEKDAALDYIRKLNDKSLP